MPAGATRARECFHGYVEKANRLYDVPVGHVHLIRMENHACGSCSLMDSHWLQGCIPV